MKETAYIGIDGGGTKTDFALCDPKGTILSRVTLKGSNPTYCGIHETLSILEEGVSRLGADQYSVRGVFAGIAGCPDQKRRSDVSKKLKELFPDAAVGAHADILNVICSTDRRGDCIAAICGTGSVAFAKKKEKLIRVGGWGPMLDTAGSGLDIGRDALRASLAEEDGFGEPTLLTPMIRQKMGPCLFDAAAALPNGDHALIASFAPLVFKAEKEGDAVASKILQSNFERLAFLILKAEELYCPTDLVILSGGVTAEEETLRKYLCPLLPASNELIIPHVSPVVGALAAARQLDCV